MKRASSINIFLQSRAKATEIQLQLWKLYGQSVQRTNMKT